MDETEFTACTVRTHRSRSVGLSRLVPLKRFARGRHSTELLRSRLGTERQARLSRGQGLVWASPEKVTPALLH